MDFIIKVKAEPFVPINKCIICDIHIDWSKASTCSAKCRVKKNRWLREGAYASI